MVAVDRIKLYIDAKYFLYERCRNLTIIFLEIQYVIRFETSTMFLMKRNFASCKLLSQFRSSIVLIVKSIETFIHSDLKFFEFSFSLVPSGTLFVRFREIRRSVAVHSGDYWQS